MVLRSFILPFVLVSISHFSFSQVMLKDTALQYIADDVTIIAPKMDKIIPWTYVKDTMRNIDIFQPNLRSSFDRKTGIQAFNGENFSQDLRISIRGFGGRSTFGIRGIRMYMDDVPLTSPDGTSQIDEVSIFDIYSMDIVRSGLAARMGNGGGGAISLKTNEGQNRFQALSRINTLGSYDIGFKYFKEGKSISNFISVNHHRFKGKRMFSEARTTSVYNKTKFKVNDRWQLSLNSGMYYSPEGKDPGSLTAEQFQSDRWQANPKNLQYQAGESVKGIHFALKSMLKVSEKIELTSIIFYRRRDFAGLLPIETSGFVDLGRNFGGCSNILSLQIFRRGTLLFGQSIEYQSDRRTLSQNLSGKKGIRQADQYEKVLNTSFFEQFHYEKGRFNLHQLIRFDLIDYTLEDLFKDNGIQNGKRNFTATNAALGIGYRINDLFNVFSNISSSFEMPTLNELSNNPFGSAGFNPSLNAEKSAQVEIGVKSGQKQKIKWAASFFYIQVRDQIQSYELPAFPGKSYFRNASKNNRKGMEAEINIPLSAAFHISLNYMYCDFTYAAYSVGNLDYSGNKQVLIPRHKANILMEADISNVLNISLSVSYNGSMWLDDANLTKSKPYFEAGFVVNTTKELYRNMVIGFQVNNIFNSLIYSNFRANAAASRYYEAASTRNAGIFIKYNLE